MYNTEITYLNIHQNKTFLIICATYLMCMCNWSGTNKPDIAITIYTNSNVFFYNTLCLKSVKWAIINTYNLKPVPLLYKILFYFLNIFLQITKICFGQR